MDYNAVWMFVKVVQAGSFSGAARQLGVPKSTVSKRISELERELRMMLLMRTTRRLQLTTSGKEYFESCARAFSQLQEAQLQTHAVQGIRGTLRLAAPEGMGATFLTGILSEFMAEYPEVYLDPLLLTIHRQSAEAALNQIPEAEQFMFQREIAGFDL